MHHRTLAIIAAVSAVAVTSAPDAQEKPKPAEEHSPARTEARQDAPGTAPGVLVRVGGLQCAAELASDPERPETTNLSCVLRLEGPDLLSARYRGEIVGAGLWLVEPGNVALAWSVLAPTRTISPDALEGDYDISSIHDFKLAEGSANLLFGGTGGSIALELLAPAVSGISPSTRMTLEHIEG